MEVHHHSHNPKNWKEYITEFIMLFAAVTLGFLAENLREHQVIIERKNQNLEAMVHDLKRDSAQIEERMSEYLKAMVIFEEMKYASIQFQKHKLSEDNYINLIINKADSLYVGVSFFINNAAYKNTISTGSLSVINSEETKILIAEYYEELSVKLNDNNRNLDQEINEYIQKTIIYGYGDDSEYRKKIAKISHKEILNNFKNIPALRKSILDPSFSLYTHKFESRCEYYLYLLSKFKEVNKKLKDSLEHKNKDKNESSKSSIRYNS